LLALMVFGMHMGFATWMALLNNFVHERANFDGSDLGWLQSIREIPGFFAVAVIVVLWVMREQILAIVSLIMLGAAVAVTAWFPTFGGLLITTFISSLGFHYYETVKQSLELQWIPKDRAPQTLGWLLAVGSAGSLIAYGGVAIAWKYFGWDYNKLYLISGSITILIAMFCYFAYPRFQGPTIQNSTLILRKRYWLFYLLQFMAGARRQIFIVFAAFMMVERFGFQVHEVTVLFLINYIANMLFGPIIGRIVQKFGERNALIFEYFGLIIIFAAYGGVYVFGWSVALAATLYVLDHLFFGLSIAQKTYFQKIADPADIASTAAVAFTINHIGAVVLPALLGYIWLYSPAFVFIVASGIAAISLALSFCIPKKPSATNETIFSKLRVKL
ncbi:MFS transporter, partial [Amylibacter sp.]|nr:MFS transporter [Amylibacter sp.]